MNIERFAKLIEAVEAAPDNRFDMGSWCGMTACGTAACACGWYAALLPDRFALVPSKHEIHSATGKAMGVSAWANEFGIDVLDAARLFCPEGHPSRQVVLARLKEYFAEHGGQVLAEAAK